MHDQRKDPWLNIHGELAHPDSPRGGSGPGGARSPRPLGSDIRSDPVAPPSPFSPAGRYISPIELADRYFASNEAGSTAKAKQTGQPQNAITDADLAKKVGEAAADRVGQSALGETCFDLPDRLLKKFGGLSADDFETVTGSKDQDYKWGDSVDGTPDIKTGDIVQFRNHKVTITVTTTTTTTTRTVRDGHPVEETSSQTKTNTRFQNRGPQHSAVVTGKNDDGTIEIAEQHIIDHNTGKLSRDVLKARLHLAASETKSKETKKTKHGRQEIETIVKIEVSGQAWFYHPKAKRK
jgi:hypothetical protein